MSTEYRRGIPSTAHVEAATRLGLLWEESVEADRWRLEIRNGALFSDFAAADEGFTNWDQDLSRDRYSLDGYTLRPIRPDGTPVDWEVLDQEVARVGQPQTMACNLTASAQAHGFRADLWQRIRAHLANGSGCGLPDVSSLDSMGFRVQSPFFDAEVFWPQGTNPADILARWTVYQELKPLYDLVDGAQGEAAMPGDVVTEWARQARGGENIRPDWELVRTPEGLLGRTTDRQGGIVSWSDSENWLGQPLRNFAAVLDAVAERRVAERMREQTPANPDAVLTVTSAQPEPRRFADVRPDRHGWRWWLVRHALPLHQTWLRIDHNRPYDWSTVETVIPTDEQGNPVSWEAAGFAVEAVRPAQESVQRAANDATPARSLGDIEWTVTGQPVTRDMTVDLVTGMVRSTHTARIRQLDRFVTEAIQAGNTGSFSVESPTPPRPGQFSNDFTASAPITAESFARVLQQMDRSAMVAATLFAETPQTRALVEAQRSREEAETRARVLQQVRNGVEQELSDNLLKQQPLPRFTTDELDDVDHSKTTKLDEVTLRRGKLPTVEQIAKYREVRARRTGGTVADALKESRIDCEVAQYMLERWAGGLGDELALWLLRAVGKYTRSDLRFTQRSVDELAQRELTHEAGSIETAEPSPIVQRERQEAEKRRQRLAELRQQLAAEQVAQPIEEMPTTAARFNLIEPDPQADPAASIRAWEARQAAAKVRPTAAPPRIAKPATAPRRPAIEVVDAEVDGLSRSEVVTALVGRAFNGGC